VCSSDLEQLFHNPHNRDLAARYSFPVPEHGSVAEFTLWIDGKPVTCEVLERQQARQVYEEEKAAGRDAGITEKESYKTFDTRVAPMRAGQDTRIRLVYLQPVQVDTGIGRYVYPLEEGGVDEEKLAFWTANEQVTGQFSFDLRVRSAYPVDAVRMPNQPQAQVQQLDEGEWQIHLGTAVTGSANGANLDDLEQGQPILQPPTHSAGNAVFTLDKDLMVYWRLKAGLPGSVELVAHKPPGQQAWHLHAGGHPGGRPAADHGGERLGVRAGYLQFHAGQIRHPGRWGGAGLAEDAPVRPLPHRALQSREP
jgi:Ca-activated chloride channel family protein